MNRLKVSPGWAILAGGLSLFVVVPLAVMVLGSLKTSAQAVSFDLSLPSTWHPENYAFVVKNGEVVRAFLNSLLITVTSVALCMAVAAPGAYVVARRASRFTAWVYTVCLLGMVAPFQVVTTFVLLKGLGLIGSYAGVILVSVAGQLSWSLFLFTGFVRTVPREMEEAACIDGASPHRTFLTVIIPLLQPVLATNIVIVAMAVWNDLLLPLYFLNSPEKWTMPLTVYSFFGQYASNWNYVFADLVLTAVPIVILYLAAQKFIIEGMTSGAVKG